MSGYSATPLWKKIGYKADQRVHWHNPPRDYVDWLAGMPEFQLTSHAPFELVHIFTNNLQDLSNQIHRFRDEIVQDGSIWISWYKRSSKLPSEVTEDEVRRIALPTGLVDIKVCAVNQDWSGLKLVIRKSLRTKA